MQLSFQTFQQLLGRMAAGVQSSASQLVDLSVGSMLRAILEANASICLWVQWLIAQTLSMTRASTSVGSDLDTWMADFLLTRQPSVAARGQVTFSRLSVNNSATVPAGVIVKVRTTNASFTVVGDSTNAAWQSDTNEYALPSGIATIELPVVAQVAGSAGNVVAGAINVIATAIPGLDFVSNTYALAGGCDPESDTNFRIRFQNYINSRSRATEQAVAYAVASIQQATRHKLLENSDLSGNWTPGQFVLIVDDGTGEPNGPLLAEAYTVVDQIRPIGSSFVVKAPDFVPVAVALSLTPGGPALNATDGAAIIEAVTAYISRLPIGSTLSTTRIIEVAYKSGRIKQNISGVLINSVASDLICTPRGVFGAQAVTVQ